MPAALKLPLLTPELCQAVHLGEGVGGREGNQNFIDEIETHQLVVSAKGFKPPLQEPSVSLWGQARKRVFTA